MLNRLTELKKRNEGFTIIEVLIVLAIAALIMVIVLVAIPQLQRNQRNSARSSDVARVMASVQDWTSNNNGAIFTPGTANANLLAVKNDLGSLGQYTLNVGNSIVTGFGANDNFIVVPFNAANGNVGNTAVTTTTDIKIVTGATCGANGSAASGSSRQIAVLYGAEGGNSITGRCISS